MSAELEIFLKLVLGAFMGGVIGFERETHGRPAGLRTHLLVCLSAVLIVIVSRGYYRLGIMDFTRFDPSRIVAGALTGMGFLGAGVIIKTRGTVYGLTTAACIWIVFAMGLAVGSGLYLPAAIAFVLTYLTLWVLRNFEKAIPRDTFKRISITADEALEEALIHSVLEKHGAVTGVEYEKDMGERCVSYLISASFKRTVPMKAVLDELAALPGIKKIRIGISA
jgi:putative Mg2+ transporter-C (MgtC) family protein